MVKITGRMAHAARLKRLRSPGMVREIGKAIKAAADELEGEAEHSITAGAASGQKGGKHQHIPSLPGQPPNEEFGTLRANIETKMTRQLTAEVSSNAPYGAALEFGTSKMAERPFMRPAAEKTRPKAQKLVADAVHRVVTKGEKL